MNGRPVRTEAGHQVAYLKQTAHRLLRSAGGRSARLGSGDLGKARFDVGEMLAQAFACQYRIASTHRLEQIGWPL